MNLTEGFYAFRKRKRILNLLERNYAFEIGKHILEVRHGLRVILRETTGGSFANKHGEGVRAILDRWIESRRPRLERRGRESHRSEKKSSAAELHHQQREAPRSARFGP